MIRHTAVGARRRNDSGITATSPAPMITAGGISRLTQPV